MTRIVITVVLSLCCMPVSAARMYQWVDPDTGTTQLSGKPPVWYRAADPGPRTFVFEKDRIVDDTGISLSERERERLRQQALLDAEEEREAAKEKLLQAKRIKAAFDQKQGAEAEQSGTVDIGEPGTTVATEQTPSLGTELPDAGAMTPEEMRARALVSEWDQQQLERARELIRQQDKD